MSGMDRQYDYGDIVFAWDEQKASRNFSKHGVRFEEAAMVFSDPFLVLMDDAGRNDEARDAVIRTGCVCKAAVCCSH